MKIRFGKCFVRKLELVLAWLAEVCRIVVCPTRIDSLLRPSPSGGCSRIAGLGGTDSVDVLPPGVRGSPAAEATGGSAGRDLTHSRCMPVPLCAPTPARRSSSFRLIRHTIRGQRGSHCRRGRPLKKATARSRSACEERLTKAQDDRDMRKIEEGPRQDSASALGSSDGIVELKYRQSSSWEVLLGLS